MNYNKTQNRKVNLLVSCKEREQIVQEFAKFRELVSFPTEMLLREFYGLDDFGIFPNGLQDKRSTYQGFRSCTADCYGCRHLTQAFKDLPVECRGYDNALWILKENRGVA